MILIYLRQAYKMMLQNKLFSAIYIIGTALSVAFVMTIFIIFYIKLGPVYPEYNRNRIVSLNHIKVEINSDEGWFSSSRSRASENLCNLLRGIEGCEALATHCGSYGYQFTVNDIDDCDGRFVNNDYWRLYEFEFLGGKPFTDADAHSPLVVVSEKFARQLFATADVVGKEISINNTRNRIVGVVKGSTGCTPDSYSQFWLPSAHSLFKNEDAGHPIIGECEVEILCSSSSDVDNVVSKVKEIIERLASERPQNEKYIPKVEKHWAKVLNVEDDNTTLFAAISKYIYIVVALLFIPALNLGGMIASRMSARMDEIGVRKSFGATNANILYQVLCENMLLTAIGAVSGLLLAYMITYTAKDWILTIFDKYVNTSAPENVITVEALFNPTIIILTLLLIMILNIISALVPTLYSLRHSIVASLNNKR